MSLDQWFLEQSRLIKVILLILPIVGWIIEILVRLSALIRNPSGANLIGFLLFLLFGWAWIIGLIDLIYCLITGQLLIVE